mgnify:CR=1 FL=1
MEEPPEGPAEDPDRKDPKSIKHRLTHEPDLSNCPHCVYAKAKRRQKRRRKEGEGIEEFTEWGELVTMDWMIMRRKDSGIDEAVVGLVVFDVGTGWLEVFPVKSREASGVVKALRHMTSNHPGKTIKQVQCDNAPEFISALDELSIPCKLSMPGEPQTNGVIERRVQMVVRGTASLLVASGLPQACWPHAARFYTLMKCLTNGHDGTSPLRAPPEARPRHGRASPVWNGGELSPAQNQ